MEAELPNPYGRPTGKLPLPRTPARPTLSSAVLFMCVMVGGCAPTGFCMGYAYPIAPGASQGSYVIQGIFTAIFMAIPAAVLGGMIGIAVDRSDARTQRRSSVLDRLKPPDTTPTFDFEPPGMLDAENPTIDGAEQ